ncbi:hypothetical protein ACN6K9_006516 [Streptomyces sp. SAS_267]|uniref:hypothetical protein n=1 Tax=Streptomyces sp. SAS_267 TaxID=3412750 RepID=UPI00403CEBB8
MAVTRVAFLLAGQPPKLRPVRDDAGVSLEEDPNTVDLNALATAVISAIGLLVLLTKVCTDAGIKIIEEIEKLREAWRRFWEGRKQDRQEDEPESPGPVPQEEEESRP